MTTNPDPAKEHAMNETSRATAYATRRPSDDPHAAVVDFGRTAFLDDEDGHHVAAVVTSRADGEHLVLVDPDRLDDAGARYDPLCRDVAHEQPGPLPRAVAARVRDAGRPRCGRRTNSTGRPCRVRVIAPGDACGAHALLWDGAR